MTIREKFERLVAPLNFVEADLAGEPQQTMADYRLLRQRWAAETALSLGYSLGQAPSLPLIPEQRADTN